MTETNIRAKNLAASALGGGLLDYAGVARLLGVGKSTVRRWTYMGLLQPDFRLGNVVRFRPATLDQFIKRNGATRGHVGH